MQQYANLDLESLVDLLVKHTNDYMNMRMKGNYTVKEITQCRHTLRELQGAIRLKSEQGDALIDYIIPDFPGLIFLKVLIRNNNLCNKY